MAVDFSGGTRRSSRLQSALDRVESAVERSLEEHARRSPRSRASCSASAPTARASPSRSMPPRRAPGGSRTPIARCRDAWSRRWNRSATCSPGNERPEGGAAHGTGQRHDQRQDLPHGLRRRRRRSISTGLGRQLDETIELLRSQFGEIGDQRLTVMAAITLADRYLGIRAPHRRARNRGRRSPRGAGRPDRKRRHPRGRPRRDARHDRRSGSRRSPTASTAPTRSKRRTERAGAAPGCSPRLRPEDAAGRLADLGDDLPPTASISSSVSVLLASAAASPRWRATSCPRRARRSRRGRRPSTPAISFLSAPSAARTIFAASTPRSTTKAKSRRTGWRSDSVERRLGLGRPAPSAAGSRRGSISKPASGPATSSASSDASDGTRRTSRGPSSVPGWIVPERPGWNQAGAAGDDLHLVGRQRRARRAAASASALASNTPTGAALRRPVAAGAVDAGRAAADAARRRSTWSSGRSPR